MRLQPHFKLGRKGPVKGQEDPNGGRPGCRRLGPSQICPLLALLPVISVQWSPALAFTPSRRGVASPQNFWATFLTFVITPKWPKTAGSVSWDCCNKGPQARRFQKSKKQDMDKATLPQKALGKDSSQSSLLTFGGSPSRGSLPPLFTRDSPCVLSLCPPFPFL